MEEFLALRSPTRECTCGAVAARAEELRGLAREVRGLFGGKGGGERGRGAGRAPVVGVEVEVGRPELRRLVEMRDRRRRYEEVAQMLQLAADGSGGG